MFGSLLGPVLADRIGRRKACGVAAFFSILSWSILGLSYVEWILFSARAMTGFFDCLAVPVGIMYISEVSEVKLKGSLLSSTTAASGIGIALAYCTGIVFYWRYACAFPIISSGLSIFLLYFCKESPVYLLTQNKPAVAALSWYRETKEASSNTDLETREELKNLEFETSSSGKGFQLSLSKLLDGPNEMVLS